MTKLRCCFCNQELEQITTSNPLGLGRIEMAVCKKCMDKGVLHIMPIWDWQELIRTRKALKIVSDCMKIMYDNLPDGNRWKWEIEKTLEQIKITTQEQPNDN